MLARHTTDSGLVYYFSPLLQHTGVSHAFSTRIGGVSEPPFDSLNLGNPGGCEIQDEDERIAENYHRLQSAIGCENRTRVSVHQVHGGDVICAMRGDSFETGVKADAIISDDPQKIAAVRVADCVPVLIASKDGSIIAAIHAGWRGVIADVISNTIRKFLEIGYRADSLIAAIGPCIGEEVFEVGPEVVAEFERAGLNGPARRTPDGKGRVDLKRAIAIQLNRAGVTDDRIDTNDLCTFRDREEFFSHRRDKGVTGRMAALIAPRRL